MINFVVQPASTHSMAPIALLFVGAFAASVYAYDARPVALRTTSGSVQTDELPVAQFSVPFTGRVSRSARKNVLLEVVRNQGSNNPSNYTAVIGGTELDLVYLTKITVGRQQFKVIVDTGS